MKSSSLSSLSTARRQPSAAQPLPRRFSTPAFWAMQGLILLGALCWGVTAHAAGLTPLEQRWVDGMSPVILEARNAGMPLDVAIRPQASADDAPVGLGFVNERCKLVLSLRGNPEGDAVLSRIPQGLEKPALELMAAHELGHCRRYLDGAWFGLPAGFSPGQVPAGLSADLQEAYRSMKSTRREEGYGDLVALAWTRQHHADQYAQLHAWLVSERTRDYLPGDHHDTLAWLQLARDPSALGAGSIFDAARPVWELALKSDD